MNSLVKKYKRFQNRYDFGTFYTEMFFGATICKERAKKMPHQNSDEDLNPQKVDSDGVSGSMTFQKKSS